MPRHPYIQPRWRLATSTVWAVPRSLATTGGIIHLFSLPAKARRSPDQQFVFIIDEINRGNISKILGELMMLIEADKRKKQYAIKLTYSNEKVREVDFGNESPDAFAISAACSSLGGSLEVHLDKEDGELIAKLDVTKYADRKSVV